MSTWWVGGYGPDMEGSGTGIGLLSSKDDGSLQYEGAFAEAASPAYLLRRGDVLYAAAEGLGTVESFGLDGTPLASVSAGGTWPCHLAFAGDLLIVANYRDGSIGVIADGTLAQVIPSADGHAHASLLLDDATLVTLDLGLDRLHLHTLPGVERYASVELPAGTGPRDIAVLPDGRLLVLGELSGQLLSFNWSDGMLVAGASADLPGFVPGDHASGIARHGEFTYVGLRGSNRIAVLNGLEPVGWVSCQGDWPRYLVASEGVLHVTNQLSNEVASFRLGPDGMPALIGSPTAVASPTHLLRRD